MATHSSVLAWRTPGMGQPGGLPSMGSHRVGHNWSDLAEAAAETDQECKAIIYSDQRQNKQKQRKPLCIHLSEGWMKIQELSQGCILPSRINPRFHRQQSDHSHPCKTRLLWITVHILKLWSTGIFHYLIVLIIETALFFLPKSLGLQDLSTPTRD